MNNTTKPIANKMQLVLDRYISFGLQGPDKWTLAWALAAIALCHFPSWPKYKTLYTMVQDMKESFKTSRKQLPSRDIENYPEHPCELPANILAYAYACDDQPVTKQVDRLSNAALKHIPLKKNSKLLAGEAKADGTSMPGPTDEDSDEDSERMRTVRAHHGHAMDEPTDEDSETTLELPGLKTPQKAPHIQPKAPQLTTAKKSSAKIHRKPAAKVQWKQSDGVWVRWSPLPRSPLAKKASAKK